MWCSEVHCTFHPSGKQFIGLASFCSEGVGGVGGSSHSEQPLFFFFSRITVSLQLFMYCMWRLADGSEVQRTEHVGDGRLHCLRAEIHLHGLSVEDISLYAFSLAGVWIPT